MADREDRYSRQVLFEPLGRAGQARLRAARVLIVGCGALGTHAAELLARAGVGKLRLVDRDVVELSNLHRQAGFTEADALHAAPKAQALAGHLAAVNSEVELDPRAVDFNYRNALELANGADLILDGSDNVLTRLLLNDVSLERRVAWIYCGAVGDTGHAQLFVPGDGPCLRCLLPEPPAPGELPTCDTAGVLGPAAAAIASFQAAMALRYLGGPVGGGPPGGAGTLAGQGTFTGGGALAGRQLRINVWDARVAASQVPADPRCPACVGGARDYLNGRLGEEAAVLCGRGAVQVNAPAPSRALDLNVLASRLRPLGSVEARPFLLRFKSGEANFTIFPDGRMIVEGTTDLGRARALYARYLGD